MTLFLLGFYIIILAFLIAGVVIIKSQYQSLLAPQFFQDWNRVFAILGLICCCITIVSVVFFHLKSNPDAVSNGGEIDIVHY